MSTGRKQSRLDRIELEMDSNSGNIKKGQLYQTVSYMSKAIFY